MRDDVHLTFSTIKRFSNWWFRHLAALSPIRPPDGLRLSKNLLVVALNQDEVIVSARQKKTWQELGRFNFSGPLSDPDRQEFQNLVNSVKHDNPVTCLQLRADRGVRKVLTFPRSSKSELSRILDHQIERVTPFRAAKVYFDYRYVERDPAQDSIKIELVAAARRSVDAAMLQFSELGFTADFVDVGPIVDDTNIGSVNLARKMSDGAEHRTRVKIVGTLAAANIVVAAIALGLPIFEKSKLVTQIEQRLETEKSRAQVTAKLRSEIDHLIAESSFFDNERSLRPFTIEIFNEVASILPDGSWLDKLILTNGTAQFYGYSNQSSSLIGLFQSSDHFKNVKYSAPVTQRDPLGPERFHISADRKTR